MAATNSGRVSSTIPAASPATSRCARFPLRLYSAAARRAASEATTAIEADAECGITRPMFPVPRAAVPARVAARAAPGWRVSCRASA